jgi:hypothetical protein
MAVAQLRGKVDLGKLKGKKVGYYKTNKLPKTLGKKVKIKTDLGVFHFDSIKNGDNSYGDSVWIGEGKYRGNASELVVYYANGQANASIMVEEKGKVTKAIKFTTVDRVVISQEVLTINKSCDHDLYPMPVNTGEFETPGTFRLSGTIAQNSYDPEFLINGVLYYPLLLGYTKKYREDVVNWEYNLNYSHDSNKKNSPDYPAYDVSIIYDKLDSVIEDINEVYINSGVKARVYLRYGYQTIDEEFEGDKVRTLKAWGRKGSGDNARFDEVWSLREKYDVKITGLKAKGIIGGRALADPHFVSGGLSGFTAAHEIGHVMGCFHETTLILGGLNNYAHVTADNSYSTIMANQESGRNRENIFSCGADGNLFYSNGLLAGSYGRNNLGRVLKMVGKNNYPKPIPSIKYLKEIHLSGYERVGVIAKVSIENDGVVSVRDSSYLELKAGGSISLKPGFSVSQGSFMKVRVIGSNTSINSTTSQRKAYSRIDLSEHKSGNYFYPNPTSEIVYLNNIDKLKEVTIYNYMGILVKNYKIAEPRLDISDLRSGIYKMIGIGKEGLIIFNNKLVIE